MARSSDATAGTPWKLKVARNGGDQRRIPALVREAGRTTAQHIAEYERQRRHATLTAVTLDLATRLTDHANDLFPSR
jgi:hypothetical protein